MTAVPWERTALTGGVIVDKKVAVCVCVRMGRNSIGRRVGQSKQMKGENVKKKKKKKGSGGGFQGI